MAFTKAALTSAPWTQGAHPLERKKISGDGLPILIEFAPGFRDAEVCVRGHIIYVLSGVLDLELTDTIERLAAGECGVLDKGTPHRASNPGPVPVQLFIVSH